MSLHPLVRNETRFLSHIPATAMAGCWEWTGSVHHDGYGVYGPLSAHRLVYEVCVGPIPAAHEIDHLCRNRRCVNPDHLEAVTKAVNWERGQAVTRINATKTVCAHGHEYTADNTIRRKNGTRCCRKCQNDSARRYRMRLSVPL